MVKPESEGSGLVSLETDVTEAPLVHPAVLALRQTGRGEVPDLIAFGCHEDADLGGTLNWPGQMNDSLE